MRGVRRCRAPAQNEQTPSGYAVLDVSVTGKMQLRVSTGCCLLECPWADQVQLRRRDDSKV
jgi:hypothetical protein